MAIGDVMGERINTKAKFSIDGLEGWVTVLCIYGWFRVKWFRVWLEGRWVIIRIKAMCDDRIVVWYDRIKPGLYNTPLTRNMKATEQGNIHLNINQHVHKIPIVVIENKGAVIMVLQVGDRD